jgi:uncharacterized protein
MSSRPFVINIGSLRRHVGETTKEHRVGHLFDVAVSETSVSKEADVIADVALTSIVGGINVKGAVTAPWNSECRRCLAEVTGLVVADVNEIFTPDEESEETYHYEDDEIDLEPLIRDAVVLALPIAPLCRDDCKGLCPNCGTNWNETTCNCEVDLRDPRWSVLDELRDES